MSGMKTKIIECLIISSLFGLFGCCPQKSNEVSKTKAVFQYSTLSALLEGVYDGEMTVGELKKRGDYGIGTFNALDGELVLSEGECYKVTSDSKVHKISDSEKIPFAAICTYIPDTVIRINRAVNLKKLENYIDSVVVKTNLIYAYKVSGRFDTIVIRSVPKQEKPYKRLIEVYKMQGIYTFTNQEGILFGYKFPEYLKDVNMDNYHFHFLSSDKSKGGHLLNCTLTSGEVSVAYVRNFTLQLPDNKYFNQTILSNKKSELMKIEGVSK
jgi:acetolactate decarboxylase